MKTLRRFRSSIGAMMIAILAIWQIAQPLQGAIYFWDTNGPGTAGFGTETGAWNGTNAFWNTDSTGGAAGTTTAVPLATDDLMITAGTAGTITITGTGTGSSLTVSNNVALTITGGTLALGGATGTSGVFVTSADNAATTIASAVTLSNNPVTFQNAGTGVLSFTGGITGAQALILQNNSTNAAGITISTGSLNNTGTVTNNGTGTGGVLISSAIGTNVTGVVQNSANSGLTLSGANLYTSTNTITLGTLSVGADNNLGATAAAVSLNGGTLRTTAGFTDTHVITVGASGGTINVVGGQLFLATANTLIGSGALTVSGPGTITFGTNAGNLRSGAAQTYSGVMSINNGGSYEYGVAGAVGAGASFVIGNQGNLIANTLVTTPNAITVSGGTNSFLSFENGPTGVFSGPITLNANVTVVLADWYTAAGTNVRTGTISGLVSGTGSMTVNSNGGTGANVLTLSGANNTYQGGTVISGVGTTVTANAAGTLGTGPVTFTGGGGTLTITAAAPFSQGATMTVTTAGTLNANVVGAMGSLNLTQTGGTVNESVANAFSGGIALNVSGGVTNLSQANGYTGGLNISGTNVTNISAVGALSGTTTVTGGTLSSNLAVPVANGGTLVLGSGGNIVLSGGLLTSPTTGGSFQNVALSSTGIINASNVAGANTIGTAPLTITNISTSGGTLQFDIASTSSLDQLSWLGNVSVGAGTNISFPNRPTVPGTYALIQTTATPTLSNFVLPSAPTGETYTLTNSGGFINLVVSGTYSAINSTSGAWIPTAAGTFSWNTASNWFGGVVPKLTGDTANFSSALAGNQTVTVDGLQHVGTLTLNPSTGFAYTLNQGTAGSTIFLDNGASAASLQNLTQNNTIAAPINLFSSNTNVNVASGTQLTLTGTTSGTGKLTMTGGSGTLNLNGTGAWTGGTQIDTGNTVVMSAVGGTASQINNAGVGTTTLNGGTLSFTATTGVTTTPAGFVLNVTGSGTLSLGGSVTNGKLLTSTNFLSGSGTLTKTGPTLGGGDWQITGSNLNFTGAVNVNGLIEVQNTAALGFGTTAGFTGGALTVGTNGEVVASGNNVQIFNPVTLNTGGTLSSNAGPAIFNSTVTVAGNSTFAARLFQTVATSQSFAINTLAGAANLSIIGGNAGTTPGMVTLGNASGFTGNIVLGINGAVGVGSGAFFGNSNLITSTAVTSAIGLVADGDGTGSIQSIPFVIPANVTTASFIAGNTGGYIIGRVGATSTFNQAANKIIQVATIPFNNGNTLNITALNGFSLEVDPVLTATTTVNVAGVQASNVLPGLTFTNTTGAFGIIKTGTGSFQLGLSAADASNTFGNGLGTVPDGIVDIQGGIVQVFSDQNLGTATNNVRLNANNAAQGFRSLGTFGTSRTFTLQTAANGIDVIFGKTLTLNTGLAYAAVGNTFQKNDAGTLVLTAAATGAPTSGTTVAGGILAITNSNQIGSGAVAVSNLGSALQLSGGGVFTQAVAISAGGVSGTVGALTNLSGATTLSGVLTIGGGTLVTNQDAGNVFTIGAIAVTTTGFNTAGVGNITIGGVISGAGFVQAAGPGLLRLTAANTTSGNIFALVGNLTLSGAGTNGGGGSNANYGGVLTLDNSGTNVNNRISTSGLGVGFHSFNTVGSGTLNLIGNNGATTTETLLSTIVGRGQTSITVTPSASQPDNLILTATGGAFTHLTFATATFASSGAALITNVGTAGTASASINTGVITTAASFQGLGTAQTGTANLGILPWALVNNNGTISLATSTVIGASGFLRNLAAGETFGTFQNYVNANALSVSNTLSTTALSTTLTTNNNIAASLFIGESVSGAGIPANNFITAISGTTITLNAAATAVASNVLITFGTTGVNLGLAAGTTAGLGGTVGQAGALTQTINSLTLNVGANLTQVNSNTVLTLANNALGGAILALDPTNNTISGGQITGGTNELIFHTAGGTLSVSSNIVGGAGGAGSGITKADGGTLTLTGTSFHAGQTVVNAGTLNLNAGNNTIQFANFLALGAGATLNLNGNSQIVTDFFSDSVAASGLGTVGSNSTITGTAGATLVGKDDSSRNYTGVIAGSTGVAFSATAAATKTLTQAQTYTGPTLINGASVILQNSAALYSAGTTGSSSLTINRAGLTLDNAGSADLAVRVPTTMAISLGGGTITYNGRASWNSAETLGVVTTTEGANTITASNVAVGVSANVLTLTSGAASGIVRTTGSTVNFTSVVGTLGQIGSNPNILFTVAPTLTNSLMGGGFTVGGTDWASYNASFGVGGLSAVGFAGYSPLALNNAGSTDNVTMAAGTGVNVTSQTINTLRITGTTAITFNASQVLTLGSAATVSGGLLLNANLTLGNVTNNGSITSNGPELFLYANAGTSVINSAITGAGVSLVKSGAATTVTLNGTNSYTGGTYVDQGTITLGNGGNVTIGQSTLGTGGIFLNGGTLVQTGGSIIPTQAATITGNGVLTLATTLSTTGSTTVNSPVITVASTNGFAVGQTIFGTNIPGGVTIASINPALNTITLSSGNGVLAGSGQTYTTFINNTLSNLTFNNDGGFATPTVTPGAAGNILTISSGLITASSNNVGSNSTLGTGNVNLNNVATPTITVNPISFNGQNVAPLQPTLIINSVIENANNVVLVNGGGNLQLSGGSTFTGGINLAAGTSLTIAGNSVNNLIGTAVFGPLGAGTLTIGTGSTLYADAGGTRVVANNAVASGNFAFDAVSNANAFLTLGGPKTTFALPAAAATTINVNAPNMTATLAGVVSGVGSSIIKTGLGTLIFANSNSFDNGITLNAGTLQAVVGSLSAGNFGTGTLTINSGVVAVKSSNQNTTFATGVTINGTLANAYIDINNNGGTTNNLTGNIMGLGTLAYTGFTPGGAAPTTILNVTGANSSKLQFSSTAIGNATGPTTFNVNAGLTLILPGGFSDTTKPVNIGPGTLVFSGTNTFSGTTTVTGTQVVAPQANAVSQPFGAGATAFTTSGNTLQITPLTNLLSTTGYTQGGVAGHFNVFATAATLNTAQSSGLVAAGTLGGLQIGDSNMSNHPAVVVGSGGQVVQDTETYNGLLKVNTGGNYIFGVGRDDQAELVVDGMVIHLGDGVAGTGGGNAATLTFGSVNLAAGNHLITLRHENGAGGSDVNLFYSGADTAGTPGTGLQAINLSNLFYNTTGVATLANGYLNAAQINSAMTVADGVTATVDLASSDYNTTYASLALGSSTGGSTLTVTNTLGSGFFGITGTTTVTGAGNIVNPTTGYLYLIGGVTDSGAGLTKTGAGTLILGPSAGTFTGTLTVKAGFLQLGDATALTTGATILGDTVGATGATLDLNGFTSAATSGLITLNGSGVNTRNSATPAGITNSLSTAAGIAGNLAIGAVIAGSGGGIITNPTIGGFGDITISGIVSDGVAGQAWNKVGPDKLTLSNAANTFTGTLTVSGGQLILGTAGALGAGVANGVSVASGAAIDLNGQTMTVLKALTINGAGQTNFGVPNTIGALINSNAGAASWAGAVVLAANSNVGGPSLIAGTNGGITLSGAVSGGFSLVKIGANSLTLTGANSENAVDVANGTLTFSGALGALSSTANANVARQGATLFLDNSGTALSNRMGNHGLFLTGTLRIDGNSATAVSEVISQGGNNINIANGNGIGQATITLNSASTGGVAVTVASTSTSIFNRGAGGTGLFRGDNLGQLASGTANSANILGSTTSLGLSTNNLQAAGQFGVWNSPNALIYQWAVADTLASGVGTGFAGYNGYNGAVGTGGIGGTSGASQSNIFGVSPISSNVNNGVATAATLSTINANTVNANATITVGSTAALAVGQLVTGTGIPANAVITAILTGTTFTISANATATANNTLTIYANPTASIVSTTNSTTTVTVASTANLYAGEVVSGTGIPNGATIASITNGTTFILSAAATATGTPTLIYSNAGYANVMSTGATINLGTALAAQEVNSLTMNAAATTTTITSGLQLDSGAVLAVGTNAGTNAYIITGAPVTSTGLNKELIFHVTGTGTTLTVNAPIFTSGGLTKSDGGMLVLGTQEFYTGNTVLDGGTTKLSGGTDTIFKVYTLAPSAGNSGTTITGAQFFVNQTATLDLNGTIQAIANLQSSATQLVGGDFILNSNVAAATLHTTQNANTTWAGNISNSGAGTLNFVRDGNNTLTINSPNTFGGSFTATGGATLLVDLGAFLNTTQINVTRSTLILDDTGVQAGLRLPAAASVTLSGGAIQWKSRSGTAATMALGNVTLGAGSSLVQLNNLNGSATLTLNSISRSAGQTISFNGNAAGGASGIGEAAQVYLTTVPTLTAGVLPAWLTVQAVDSNGSGQVIQPGFATYTGNGIQSINPSLVTIATGNVPLGANARVNANVTLPNGGATLNTISFLNAAATISFVAPGDILTVTAGGILGGLDANNRAIGTTAIPGVLTTGVGQQELFLHNATNTLTINSKIVDNGAPLSLVIDSMSQGGTITLGNANTYTGTTYLNHAPLNLNSLVGPAIPGNLIVSGGNANAADSSIFNTTTVNWLATNQIATTATITMNGQTQLNIGNSVPIQQTVSNSQTINNLIFQNDGGLNTGTGGGPTIFTGAGGLTINGTLTSTANTEVATIPVINGQLVLTTGAIVVDPNQFVPGQIGLAINATINAPSITKTGLGWLGIGGQSMNLTGAFNLNAGGLATSANIGTAGPILAGQVIMAANTTIDPRGLTLVLGSIASTQTTAQLINGLQGTAGTIVTGLDGVNSSFAGTINSPFLNGLLNITKIGAGTWTLTNDSTATNNGTLTINGGAAASNGITVNGASGKISFTTMTLTSGGTLLLDNSVTAVNNRLGTSTLTTTAAVLAPTYRTLNMNGGNLTVNGNSGTAVSEGIGNIASLTGGGIITLGAASTAGVNVTIGQIVSQAAGTSLLIRGDGLGSAAGANTATVLFTTSGAAGTFPGLSLLGGAITNATTTKGIRPDILVDASATGVGTSFLTVDSVTGLVRALNAGTEMVSTFTTATPTNTNVNLSTVAFGSSTANALAAGQFAANLTLGSLTLQNGGGVNLAIVPTNPWGANGGLLTISPSAGGILSLGGNNSITAGNISSAGVTTDYWVTAGTLTVTGTQSGTSGFTKAGAGTLILNTQQITNTNQPTVINGGTLQFAANMGANPLWVLQQATIPNGAVIQVNNGTLDVNGNNQLFNTITTTNPLPFSGGTAGSPNSVITNSNATAATITTNGAATTIGTVFSGNLSLDKAGVGVMTLSSPQTYTGTTTIRGGRIALRDIGAIASTGAINLLSATLELDNTGFGDSTTRISASAPINMTGGSFRVDVGSRVESSSIGTVTLNGGQNEIQLNGFNNNANTNSFSLTVGNLVQGNNATLNIVGPVSTALGNLSGANNHVFLTQVNGSPYSAANMVNGIIAPWFTVNQNDWATYSNLVGVTTPNANGTPNYSGNTLNVGVAADNISIAATLQGITGRTINSLAVRAPAAGTTIALNGTTDQLVIASGGVILNTAQTVNIQGGSLTAGALNTASTLYLNSFSTGVTTFNTPIVNNGATMNTATGAFSGGTGALTLVRAGGGLVTLAPLEVESVAFAANAPSSTSLTIPNSTGLFVGMGVSGGLIAANTTITAITGNVLTLSVATTLNGATAATNQITFAPPVTTATSTTTQGSTTVTTAANAFATGFTPVVGMAVGGPNILGGATLVSFTGTNASGFTFVLSQPAIVTGATAVVTVGALSEAYTGATIASSGSLNTTGGNLTLAGLPGAITVLGDLTINNSTVTMSTNQGQISQTSNVRLNNGAVLNLVGTNWLNNTVTFNDGGGTATPTLAVGTLLDLSSAAAINATNDNTGSTPTISGTTLNLSSATGTTITVAGLSLDSLIISAQITTNGRNTLTTTGQTITKTGAGTLVLSVANAAVLLWNLNQGTIVVANGTALGAAGSTLSITGSSALVAGNPVQTIALPITFNAAGVTLTLGDRHGVNQVTLAGTVNLNGNAPTFAVGAQATTDTITGQIIGAGGFTKAGQGALTLTPGTASTFTGPVTLTGGLITLGNANGLNMSTATPGTNLNADVTVGTPAEININAFSQTFGSLAGGGIVTDSGGAAALTIGGTTNATNATFSGSLVAATAGNLSLIKTGTNNQTLSGQSYYTGVTTVSGGTLTLKNGSLLATTPTLATTAITVAVSQTLAVSAAGADVGTSNTVNIGNNTTTASGASLSLSSGATGANFTMADGLIGTFNVLSGATFAGPSLTVGGAGAVGPVLTFDLNATQIDTLNLTKNVTVGASGGKLAFNILPGTTSLASAYTFINASAGLGVAGLTQVTTSYNVGGTTYTGSLATSTATQEILTFVQTSTLANAFWGSGIGSSAATLSWNTFLSGLTNWSSTQPTFTEAGVLPAFSTNVNFSVQGTTNLTTALGANFSIESLTFLASNTAATSISGNTLTINATGQNGNTLGNGINVQSGAGAVTITSNVTLGANQTWTNNSAAPTGLTVSGTSITAASNNNLTITGSGNTTISAAIQTGSGGLTKLGAGTLTLSGVNTYSGVTTVNGGTLSVSASGNLGNNTATNTIVLDGGTLQSTGTFDAGANRAVSLGAGGGTVDVTGANTLTLSGAISGPGALTKIGTGTSTLAGSTANTYSGVTTVTGGTLLLDKTAGTNAIVGDGASSKTIADVLINGGTLKLNASNQIDDSVYINMTSGTFNVNGKTETIYNFTNSGGTFTLGGRGASLTVIDPTWSGGANDIAAGTAFPVGVLNISGGANTVHGNEQYGPAVDSGGGVLTVGTGGLNFQGATNPNLTINSDYAVVSPGTARNQGLLILNGDATFTNAGAAATASITNGVSRASDGTTSLGFGTVAGTVDLGAGTRSFTVNNGGGTNTLLIDAQIVNGGIIKAGAGTLALFNNAATDANAVNVANTYAGGTTINAGTIAIDSNTSLGATAGVTTINAGTLQATQNITTTRSFTLGDAASTVAVDNGKTYTVNGVFSSTGALNKTGAGTLVLGNTNTYGGATNVNGGILQVNGTSGTGTTTVNANATLAGTGTVSGAATVTGTNSANLGLLKPGSTGGTINGSLAFSNGLTINTNGQVQMQITTPTTNDGGIATAIGTGTYFSNGGAAAYNPGGAGWNVAPSPTSNHDYVNVTGTFTLNARSAAGLGFGSLAVQDNSYLASATTGDVFNLLDWTSVVIAALPGNFTTGGVWGDIDLPTLGLAGGSGGQLYWDTSLFASSGILVVVPEPGRMMLLLLGLAGLLMRRRRKISVVA